MKPKLKTELIRLEYWDCGNPDHRHKTEAVASACIEKRENRTARCTGARNWTNEAYAAVLKQHREGARQCDIARSLGLSKERARQVLAKAETLERHGRSVDPLYWLSTRTRNALMFNKLDTVEAVRAALESGRLDKVRNIGAVSKDEVRHWLEGLPPNDIAQGREHSERPAGAEG